MSALPGGTRLAALALAGSLVAAAAAADGVASLAAPGDCAQPELREARTSPVQAFPPSVAGPPGDDFTPVDVAGGLLGLDLADVPLAGPALRGGLAALPGGPLLAGAGPLVPDVGPVVPGLLPLLPDLPPLDPILNQRSPLD